MFKRLLQGKPFGHPLHPALVHFPVGAFLLSFLFDLSAFIFEEEALLSRAAYYLILLGVTMALLAAIPGFADWYDIRRDHPAKRPATLHMLLNLAAVGLYGISLFLRSSELSQAAISPAPFLISLAALGLIFYSGYLGGSLIYADGISVGRHRRSTDTPDHTILRLSGSAKAGYVQIGPANDLWPGETWRVEIDGEVMAVVNLDGKFHAFQEFCTHRFGPLSEGSFKDGCVECPWHRSRFDLSSGGVVRGPAKVDLKIYPVSIREGLITIQLSEHPKREASEMQRAVA